MRALVALSLLLLACGCDRLGGGKGSGDEANAQADPLANLQILDRNADPVRIQQLLAQAMPAALGSAKNPRYQNVRPGAGGSVCGEVSAAGEPARPFVVTPDAVAVVAPEPRLHFSDPSDFVADAYVRWCATPEEMKGIEAEIKRAAADPANIVMSATANVDAASVSAVDPVPPPPEAAPVPAPATPPPAARSAPAKQSSPQPTGDIDSFMNAVRR